MRNQIGIALVTIAVILPATVSSAKRTMPDSKPQLELAEVGAYPTRVIATVKSVEVANGAILGQAARDNKVCCLLKLQIHSSKALTPMGTPIQQDESIRVISVRRLNKALIGKTVQASLEMRSDDAREQWLLTDVSFRK